jgi:hypothetical protein
LEEYWFGNDYEVDDELELFANDIDIYHRSFTQDINKSMIVDFEGGIKKFQVAGFSQELNIATCDNLSAKGFLGNNDLNTTASCFDNDLQLIPYSPSTPCLLFGNWSLRNMRIGSSVQSIHSTMMKMVQPVT